MPILDIEVVGSNDKLDVARPIANAAAAVLKTEAGRTWVKIRFLPINQYAENGTGTAGVQPVFVSLLMGKNPESDEKSRIASELATALAGILDRPKENVHIIFEQEAAGRIAFGGQLKF